MFFSHSCGPKESQLSLLSLHPMEKPHLRISATPTVLGKGCQCYRPARTHGATLHSSGALARPLGRSSWPLWFLYSKGLPSQLPSLSLSSSMIMCPPQRDLSSVSCVLYSLASLQSLLSLPFFLWSTTGDAQSFLLALNSGITPDGDQGSL